MRKLKEDVKQKEERKLFLSDEVGKNDRTEAEMKASLQSLQAGEETRGSSASQGVNCCINLEGVAAQLGILGAEKSDVSF